MKKLVIALMLLVGAVVFAEDIFIEPPLEFDNTPVKTALDTIFMKAGNVPFSIEVKKMDVGNVTLKLTEKTELETLLKLILDTKGIVFEKDANGVYHIKDASTATTDTKVIKVTKLYALTYATAGEIVRQVKGVLTKDGVISVDVGTNSLIITDVAEVFEGVENLLKELDNPERKAKLISVRTKLIEITKQNDTKLQIDFQYTRNAAIQIGGGTIPTIPAGTGFGTATPVGNAGTSGGFYLGPLTWTATMESIIAQLYATTTSNSVDMVADPEVLVEDGTEARVQIGSKQPILTVTAVAGAGNSITYTYQDVNIILTVTPQSQRDGTISVQINPQLNQISGYAQDPTGQASVPIIDNREVRTKLFVNNGGTIKLGGMIKDRTTISELKVPFLGDIPLLGLLFKKTNPITEKVEIQILTSPHIVDYAPPRCKDTPWISVLEASMVGDMDVKIDWSKDLPFGANGIFTYNIYRDVNPITTLEDRRPFASGISGDSTSWIDSSKKRKGGTYYYVVTAVNPSGMEQAISPDPKFNAAITIPER